MLACHSTLEINPEEIYPYKYAGKSLLELGQLEKAKQYLLKAHQLDSSDPETIKDIGNVFLSLGNNSTALRWYEKALDINSNYAPALNNIASIKKFSGSIEEALCFFSEP